MSEQKITAFYYLNLINQADQSDIEVDDKVYNQFLVNRGLSLHIDTIALANEMNKYGCVSNQMHFDFLRNTVNPRKRWAKWPKPKSHKSASIISQYYGISLRKAYDYIGIIDDKTISDMEEELNLE